MSRKRWPLAALATVALIGAGASYGYAADGKTGPKGSPGTLPSKGSSRPKGSPSAPGRLPSKPSSPSKWSPSAPGTLPPKGSSR
jgi:hypothetical protein